MKLIREILFFITVLTLLGLPLQASSFLKRAFKNSCHYFFNNADLLQLNTISKTSGVHQSILQNLKELSVERDYIIIIRSPNKPNAAKLYLDPGYEAKGREVLFTTDADGILRLPKELNKFSQGHWLWLKSRGYWLDKDRVIHSPRGSKTIFSDIDEQAIYRNINVNKNAPKEFILLNTNSELHLNSMNAKVSPLKDMFKHGANDNYYWVEPISNKKIPKRYPHLTESFIAFKKSNTNAKKGQIVLIDGVLDLKKFYKANNLEWIYDNFEGSR